MHSGRTKPEQEFIAQMHRADEEALERKKRQRADKLAAKLRELGIDPDQL